MLFQRIILIGLNFSNLFELLFGSSENINSLILFGCIQFRSFRLFLKNSIDFFDNLCQIGQFDISKEFMF